MSAPTHPVATVPDRLFADDAREQRWRARFTAPRMSRPDWARDAPDRSLYTSNASGTVEVYAWDRRDRRPPPGDRPAQRHAPRHAAAGRRDHVVVRRHRRRRVRALGRRAVRRPPGHAHAVGAVPPCRASRTATRPGSRSGARLVAVGTSTDDGTRIWLAPPRRPRPGDLRPRRGRRRRRRSPTTRRCWRSPTPSTATPRHPAVRVRPDGGRQRGRGEVRRPGPRPDPARRSPRCPATSGCCSLHERRGREELLIWDVDAGTETEIVTRPARRARRRLHPDGPALLVGHTHAARSRLYRYDLATGALTEAGHRRRLRGRGATSGRTARSSTRARRRRSRRPSARCTGRHGPRPARPAGRRAPRARCRSRTSGWTARAGRARAGRPARGGHGAGPDGRSACTAARTPPTRTVLPRRRAAWVDAGFAVVQVNYRGSTGYGSAWRDALEGRPGLTELEDVAAVVRRAASPRAIVDPQRRVVEGWSWGGYLALLRPGHAAGALGRGHRRGAGGRLPRRLRGRDGAAAGVRPGAVRRLAGGGARRLPCGRRRSPTSTPWPRPCSCWPARTTRAARSGRSTTTSTRWRRSAGEHEVCRFDAGHGSLVVEETMRHAATEIAFARRACGLPEA